MTTRTMNHANTEARPQRRIFSLSRRGALLVLGVMALSIALAGIVYAQSQSRLSWDECSENDSKFHLGHCVWQKSNIAQNQSGYIEGMAVPVRFITTLVQKTQIINGLFVDIYTWQFDWGTTSNHGFDWLVSWDQASRLHDEYQGVPLELNRCANLENDVSSLNVCNLVVSDTTGLRIAVAAPDDPFLSGICGAFRASCSTQDRINAFESVYGNRFIDLYVPKQAVTPTATLQLWHTLPSGSDYLTSSYVGYTLTVTSTQQITSSMIAFASHLALSGSPYTNPLAWGEYPVAGGGVGAAPIPGASWHHLQPQLNGDGGSTDMQVVLLSSSSSAPILSSSSKSTISTAGVGVTDTITMTHGNQDPQIFGTVQFSVCYWPSRPPLEPYSDDPMKDFPGCASSYMTDVVQLNGPVTLNVITASNRSTAVSPTFVPTRTGYYCFNVAFTPTGTPRYYTPMADTNPYSTTVTKQYRDQTGKMSNFTFTPECFQVEKTTAVGLSTFSANAGDGISIMGFPVVGLAIGLMGLVASAGVGLFAWKSRNRKLD